MFHINQASFKVNDTFNLVSFSFFLFFSLSFFLSFFSLVVVVLVVMLVLVLVDVVVVVVVPLTIHQNTFFLHQDQVLNSKLNDEN